MTTEMAGRVGCAGEAEAGSAAGAAGWISVCCMTTGLPRDRAAPPAPARAAGGRTPGPLCHSCGQQSTRTPVRNGPPGRHAAPVCRHLIECPEACRRQARRRREAHVALDVGIRGEATLTVGENETAAKFGA